jgi:hypothetical protein
MKEHTVWPYLAGIIDGEGTISINRQNARHDSGIPSTRLDITIVNTDERLMVWLIKNVGGRYYMRKRQDSPKHKFSYAWRLTGRANKERLLLGVLPYLIMKADQAKLGLEFLRLNVHQRIPEKRYELMLKCQALNKKGPTTPETNTQECPVTGHKIESVLTSDSESEPVVKQALNPARDWSDYNVHYTVDEHEMIPCPPIRVNS